MPIFLLWMEDSTDEIVFGLKWSQNSTRPVVQNNLEDYLIDNIKIFAQMFIQSTQQNAYKDLGNSCIWQMFF